MARNMSSLSVRILEQDTVLRGKARKVPLGPDFQDLVSKMREAMVAHDGIGIAAPQIGEPLRIFLVAKNLFPPETQAQVPSDVFVNPRIVRSGFKRDRMEEGCLSVPGVFGVVERKTRMTIEAYDASWKKFRVSAEGLLARVFQHELDHLEGILFVDRAKPESLHEILSDGKVQPWRNSET